jgi:hypothetical protein
MDPRDRRKGRIRNTIKIVIAIGARNFARYSVGWNENDDGGTVVLKKDGRRDWEKGDWVWRLP